MVAVRALSGVGMVASRARMIKPGLEFEGYFPKPTYEDPLLSQNAENEDTLQKFIPQMVTQYKNDTERISLVLKQSTLEGTCKAIWNFLYNYIQYKLDEPHEEQIRRPARSFADRASGIDCDCASVFISTILLNLGIRHFIRMTAYNRQRGFQHVYIVVPKTPTSNLDKRSDYIVIDFVMDAFDSEKPFIFKKDKEMNPAFSAGLNGFPARALNGAFQARSNFVYDDVYYMPLMGTWALKGIDGGYYIRGDKNLRYVEPLNGLDGGLFKKIIKTATKAIAPLAKSALNTVIPGAGAALTLAKSLTSKGVAKGVIKDAISNGKSSVSSAVSSEVSNANNAVSSEVSNANSAVNSSIQQMNQNSTAIESKIKTANNNMIQSVDATETAIQKSITANNKAVITSLDAVDKASKERIDKITSTLNQSLDAVKDKASTTEEATKIIQELAQKTASLSAGTQVINREQNDVIKKEAQQNENFRSQVSTWGKYILIAIALVIAWVMFRKKKSTVSNT